MEQEKKKGPYKEPDAARIVQEAREINAGALVENMQGDTIQGHLGQVFTKKQLDAVYKKGIDPELQWCRAAANQMDLNVTYMDWYWYQKNSDEEIDAYLLKVRADVEERARKKKNK